MTNPRILSATLILIGVITACDQDIPEKHAWIGASTNARWTAVAGQLRGMDVAMVEIDYRYQELYWAGKDSNWAYADYQATKIGLALENALLRRPKRRASADRLFMDPLANMKSAISHQQATGFDEAFSALNAACNACHSAEGFPSFQVQVPGDRQSSIATAR